MAYGTPADPVGGTVITVAYAVSNLLNPIRWLRLLTGNADPPGSSYVVVSDSTTGTTWRKVPADALAAGVAVANLGYTPVNKAGDGMSGNLDMANSIQVRGVETGGVIKRTLAFLNSSNQVGIGDFNVALILQGSALGPSYYDGTTLHTVWTSGNDGPTSGVSAQFVGGLAVSQLVRVDATSVLENNVALQGKDTPGAGGTARNLIKMDTSNQVIAGDGARVLVLVGSSTIATGALSAASYTGGNSGVGTVSAKGLVAGSDGIGSDGPVDVDDTLTANAYAGGTTANGQPSFFGIITGAGGVVVGSGGLTNAGSYNGGDIGAGEPEVLGLHVGVNGIASAGPIAIAGQAVYYPGNPPPLGSGAAVPSGLIAGWQDAATIPTGWTRLTAADGRYLVGAGTASGVSNAQTFTQNANAGSTDFLHKHVTNSLAVSVTGSAVGGVSDVTGNNSASGQSAGTGTSRADSPHNHSLNGVTLAVSASGTATGDTSNVTWVPPAFALVWIKKT